VSVTTAIRAMMMQQALIKYALVLILGTAIGAAVNGWRMSSKIKSAEAEHASQITDIVRVAAAAAGEALARQQRAQSELSQIDQQYTQELTNARAEADRLRDDVADSQRQLRVQATCPDTSGDRVRGATTSTSMDDAARPRLTDTAQRDYWRLRDRIATITAQVNGLQAYIRTACTVTH